jgi:hypothetical protein
MHPVLIAGSKVALRELTEMDAVALHKGLRQRGGHPSPQFRAEDH